MYEDTSKYLTTPSSTESEFGKYVESSLIPLALDHPDLFLSIGRFISPDLFEATEAKYIIAVILNYMEKHQVIPTRGLLRDFVLQHLTEDDPYEPVLALIDRKSNPRDVPILKEQMVTWARKKAFGLIYSDEAMLCYQSGDFESIEKIIQDARRITDLQTQGIWLLDNYDIVLNPQSIEHRTTGFPKLDVYLNSGGPSPKEVLCWLAGTNVGKSIVLCNNAITSWQGPGPGGRIGQDVLLVTFELDYIKTGMRCLGVINENIPLDKLVSSKDLIHSRISSMKTTYDGRIFIAELPPEECSVDHLYHLLDNMRRQHGWHPDVVILDYLDLMMSRQKSYNDSDYTRQKHVANEVRGFAKNENVLVFTATQTNRGSGQNGQDVGLKDAAESYAKQFSMDYIVAIAQNPEEREASPSRFRFQIAKNRNGPKQKTITCEVNYNTMKVKEVNS